VTHEGAKKLKSADMKKGSKTQMACFRLKTEEGGLPRGKFRCQDIPPKYCPKGGKTTWNSGEGQKNDATLRGGRERGIGTKHHLLNSNAKQGSICEEGHPGKL